MNDNPSSRKHQHPHLLDEAIEAVSSLAVLWAFGLALLLILAHRM